ncbi:MAG: hypothetical protein EOO75_09505 [Myxococcales bacterium]|nr:MAG: hypothetical protein EOO75_09505 [Myxococcales bacterium]
MLRTWAHVQAKSSWPSVPGPASARRPPEARRGRRGAPGVARTDRATDGALRRGAGGAPRPPRAAAGRPLGPAVGPGLGDERRPARARRARGVGEAALPGPGARAVHG